MPILHQATDRRLARYLHNWVAYFAAGVVLIMVVVVLAPTLSHHMTPGHYLLMVVVVVAGCAALLTVSTVNERLSNGRSLKSSIVAGCAGAAVFIVGMLLSGASNRWLFGGLAAMFNGLVALLGG
jgi:uncharacterized membrane protein